MSKKETKVLLVLYLNEGVQETLKVINKEDLDILKKLINLNYVVGIGANRHIVIKGSKAEECITAMIELLSNFSEL